MFILKCSTDMQVFNMEGYDIAEKIIFYDKLAISCLIVIKYYLFDFFTDTSSQFLVIDFNLNVPNAYRERLPHFYYRQIQLWRKVFFTS